MDTLAAGRLVEPTPRFDPDANLSDRLAPRCGCRLRPSASVRIVREWHPVALVKDQDGGASLQGLEYSVHVECCRCGASWTWGQPGGAPPAPAQPPQPQRASAEAA